jgi:hypothetical protein
MIDTMTTASILAFSINNPRNYEYGHFYLQCKMSLTVFVKDSFTAGLRYNRIYTVSSRRYFIFLSSIIIFTFSMSSYGHGDHCRILCTRPEKYHLELRTKLKYSCHVYYLLVTMKRRILSTEDIAYF